MDIETLIPKNARIIQNNLVIYPTLYKLNSGGKTLEWHLERDENKYQTISGQQDGLKTTSAWTTALPKNIGKKNETTGSQQADKECLAKYEKKLKSGSYVLSIKDITNKTYIKPMLAETYYSEIFDPETNTSKIKNNIPSIKEFNEGIIIQRKLDGAVAGSTKLDTNLGKKTIKEIVENKLDCTVLSYNQTNNVFEYKKVLGYSNEIKSDYTNWMQIKIGSIVYITCTKDHPILTKRGWIETQYLNTNADEILVQNYDLYLKSLLLGTLLGDSCLSIDKRCNSYRLKYGHTNLDYFNFKKEILNISGKEQDYISGYGSAGKIFTSNALTRLIDLNLFYKDGRRKTLSKRFLCANLSQEALSLWIADDGSLRYNNGNKSTPILSISTHNHSEAQMKEFVAYFTSKWKCTPTLIKDKRVTNVNGYFLNFNTKDTLYILNFLKDKQCKGVEYKYYFPTEGYIKKADLSFEWVNFSINSSRRMTGLKTQYDIAVEDNQNFVANGVVVHNCRMILSKEGAFSRKGEIIQGVPHIVDSMKEFFIKYPETILDGELYSHDLEFNVLNGTIRREIKQDSSAQADIRDEIKYYVYDLINEDIYKERALALNNLSLEWSLHVFLLEGTFVSNLGAVTYFHNKYVEEGYEGAILRKVNAKYQKGKRTKDLLKVKEFQDCEYTILDIIEGDGNNSGMAAKILINDNGVNVYPNMVGSWDFCRKVLEEKENYIGGETTIKFFGRTPDGSLRHPTVKTLFKNKRDM